MKKQDLAQFSNEELQIEAKKRKSSFNLFKVFIGIMIGSAIFTTCKQGFSFFTLFPIFFFPLIFTMKAGLNEIKKEIKSRKL